MPYFKISDNCHVIYRFVDGSVSELTYLMGPAATIQRELGEDDAGMTGRIVEELSREQPQDTAYYHNTRDVVRRVANGLSLPIDPRDALETTRLCLAATESAQTGAIVKW